MLVELLIATLQARSLAAALQSSQSLDKPLVVDESGMVTCERQNGRSLETAESRAAKFDAKLSAFFAHGGDGYLVWTWSPDSSCGSDFTSGDPVSAVLARHAAVLRNEVAEEMDLGYAIELSMDKLSTSVARSDAQP